MPRGKSVIATPKAKITAETALIMFERDCKSRNLRPATIATYKVFIQSYVNYIGAGGGVFQLQRILDHADISTTRHYVSLYNSDLKKDYDALCPLDNILK